MKFNTLIFTFASLVLSTIVLAAEPISVTMQSSLEGQMIYEVPLGAHVKKGQLVEQINPTEYKNQLKIDAAKYKDAKDYYDSIKPLVHTTVSMGDYIHDKWVYKEALSQYKKDEETIKHTKIYAPFDGVVTKINVYPGSGIGDGNDIMTITKS